MKLVLTPSSLLPVLVAKLLLVSGGQVDSLPIAVCSSNGRNVAFGADVGALSMACELFVATGASEDVEFFEVATICGTLELSMEVNVALADSSVDALGSCAIAGVAVASTSNVASSA